MNGGAASTGGPPSTMAVLMGFHGLSYEFLVEELARLGDPAATKSRVILAHLGNGAGMAAVRDGKSIDTSMGFTPTAGLVMSSRSGDLDPGLVSHLARTEKMSPMQFEEMVNHASGLAGLSRGGMLLYRACVRGRGRKSSGLTESHRARRHCADWIG